MGKKKGAIAAKARARREQRNRSPRSLSPDCSTSAPQGPIVPADGQRVHRGLSNLGNTCFLNSIVQCLNVSLPFSDELMRLLADGLDGISGSLCAVFRGIRMLEDTQGSKAPFSPKPLREELISRFPWYRGKEQHDAHELLRTLLGSIADEPTVSERSKAKEQAAAAGGKPMMPGSFGSCGHCVSRSFRGHLCAATLCWGCSKVSLRLDPFLDISLDLPSLAGQSVGALGLTSAMASGNPAPQHGDGAAPESADERSKQEGKERKRRAKSEALADAAKAKPAAEPKAPKATRPPTGVWAARNDSLDSEEYRARISTLIGRIVVRALRKGSPTEPGTAAEADGPSVEIELSRQSKKCTPQWGFKWSEKMLDAGSFVLSAISEDSPLEKWNIKRRAMGDEELAICVGDRLVEVNGQADPKDMRKALKSEDKVVLQFVRSKSNTSASLGKSCEESDGEADRQAALAAARERSRQLFCDSAARCHEALPSSLREIFGPETPTQEPNGHLRLEDCLRRFSVVEALEDEYNPVYQCSVCGNAGSSKAGSSKTFASRRMWLWQADLPPLLTLQLKRFRRYFSKFEKSTASIALPTLLDLRDFVLTERQLGSMAPFVAEGLDLQHAAPPRETASTSTPSLRYELYGICVHQGATMHSGHYVAYVNGGASLESEAWFGISDARIWTCTRSEVLKAEAYIAFYRREGMSEARVDAREPRESSVVGDEATPLIEKAAARLESAPEVCIEEDAPADGHGICATAAAFVAEADERFESASPAVH